MVTGIIIAPAAFLDLRFYYEYVNAPETQEIIEVEERMTKRIKPYSLFIGRGLNGYIASDFVYTKDAREFLLGGTFEDFVFINEPEKESLQILEEMREKGELTDSIDSYIDEKKDIINRGNKFKISYKKTKRYSVITSIENVE